MVRGQPKHVANLHSAAFEIQKQVAQGLPKVHLEVSFDGWGGIPKVHLRPMTQRDPKREFEGNVAADAWSSMDKGGNP